MQFAPFRYQAIIRLVGAMMMEQNDEWSLQRRYMQLEGIQSLSENQSELNSQMIALNSLLCNFSDHALHIKSGGLTVVGGHCLGRDWQ